MLYLVSTPIGNLNDISLRALEILKSADIILTEDTRHTGLLLKHFEIPHKPFISLYDEVESEKINDILDSAKHLNVALVSDAGTPLISDPGYKLVREAIKNGIKVTSIPGATAAITALTLSGLPPDKFIFMGYPPEKEGHQKDLFEKVLEYPYTVIFYVSPHKLLKSLKLLKELKPDLVVTLARELTKIYEEVWTGNLDDAMLKFKDPKGEFVLLWHN